MRSTYVARDASVAVVADQLKSRTWQLDHAPAVPIHDRTKHRDELRSARGILYAVIAGAVVWAAIGFSAMTLLGRLQG